MLILKQANKSRPGGHWDANDFDVFEADLSLLKNILGRGIGLPALRRDMLGAELVPGAAAKRDWNLQLSAIKSIHILAIKPSVPVATAPCRQYKLKLEADVSADPTAAIPSYGWEDNPNYRWIRLCPAATGAWTITSFGTGP